MKKKLITAVVLVLVMMSGVVLFGTIKIIDATQMDKLVCIEHPQIDCTILEKQETPCPKPTIPPCTRKVER